MIQHASGRAGQRESVDVNALVAEYIEPAYHGKRAQTADFDAEVIRDFGTCVGQVEIVPQEIGRVLLNLLSMRAVPGGAARAHRADAAPTGAAATAPCTSQAGRSQ